MRVINDIEPFLPAIHKDLFHRMLISQAIIEKLTLITLDKQIAQHNVNCLFT